MNKNHRINNSNYIKDSTNTNYLIKTITNDTTYTPSSNSPLATTADIKGQSALFLGDDNKKRS